jgi:hypothetical protein
LKTTLRAKNDNNKKVQKIALQDSTCFFLFCSLGNGKQENLRARRFGFGNCFLGNNGGARGFLDRSFCFLLWKQGNDHDHGIDCLCKNTSIEDGKQEFAKIVACKIITVRIPRCDLIFNRICFAQHSPTLPFPHHC